ncbi:hypothetical protein E5Q_01492 [Mixia osmundae IAM 14324]|uniref:Uncharacterized protein n=1 Tax=Mixia osmundae (strain CBS 9802 / IAM 14324 / JCM 22182 / KY 12970) TaxID=764103 RepID=G7DW32_MIXOS|nr:hypothetical protein E5Q_01492 [Mixia osmundae IAM 14324]
MTVAMIALIYLAALLGVSCTPLNFSSSEVAKTLVQRDVDRFGITVEARRPALLHNLATNRWSSIIIFNGLATQKFSVIPVNGRWPSWIKPKSKTKYRIDFDLTNGLQAHAEEVANENGSRFKITLRWRMRIVTKGYTEPDVEIMSIYRDCCSVRFVASAIFDPRTSQLNPPGEQQVEPLDISLVCEATQARFLPISQQCQALYDDHEFEYNDSGRFLFTLLDGSGVPIVQGRHGDGKAWPVRRPAAADRRMHVI